MGKKGIKNIVVEIKPRPPKAPEEKTLEDLYSYVQKLEKRIEFLEKSLKGGKI